MKYWISKKGNDKLIVISDDIIYNFNPSKRKLLEFEAQLKKGIIPERLTGTPFRYIKIISSESNSTKILIEFMENEKLELDLAENKSAIIEYLKNDKVNFPRYKEKNQNLFNRIKRPVFGLLILASLTSYIFNIARNMELGYTYETVGGRLRGGAFSGLFLGLAEFFGSTAIMIIGVLLSIIPIYFIWKRSRKVLTIEKLIYF